MCETRGCCYSNTFGCYHYYPSQYQYTHSLMKMEPLVAPLRAMTTLGETAKKLYFGIEETTENHLKINLNILPPYSVNKV